MNDDRLDALAIAVNYWTEQMSQDVNEKMNDRREDALNEELERFMSSAMNSSPLVSKSFKSWF